MCESLTMTQSIHHVPYFPDRNEYETRILGHLPKEAAERSLPHGFPQRLTSDMAWEGKNISLDHPAGDETSSYLLVLNDAQLDEIDAALRHFQSQPYIPFAFAFAFLTKYSSSAGLSQPIESLGPSTFPLPGLHSSLRSASDNLHSGYGFTLIRGVPVDQYSREENIIIYVGISAHIAVIRGRQDHQFEGHPADVMLAHITDMRRPGDVQDFALAAYADGEVVYHTDVGDIVSLFVLSGPLNGGESLLASAWTVYNALAETRPDLIRVLAEDWPIPSAKQPGLITHRPLLVYQAACGEAPERVILQFSRRSFSGFGTHAHSHMLTPLQLEALDALHFLAEKFHVSMKLKTGDMQFINNLSMIHARNSYVDDSENR
ncbi:hypothetical protein N7454_001890 [Penicillium verhagenii]|nr:hypothetical protein N7454_001890 [Penicillium verhagenii]